MVVTPSRWYGCETWILASDVRLDGGAEGLVRIELFCAKERSSRRPSWPSRSRWLPTAGLPPPKEGSSGETGRPALGGTKTDTVRRATTLVTGADGEPLEKDAGRACAFKQSRTAAIYT